MADRMDVSDKTAISMPMRNLLSILAAVAIGVYAFFGIQERLNNVETRNTLMEADLVKNTEFRIKYPRVIWAYRPEKRSFLCWWSICQVKLQK